MGNERRVGITAVMKSTGLSRKEVISRIEEGLIHGEARGKYYSFLSEELERLIELKESYIGGYECLKKIGSCESRFHLEKKKCREDYREFMETNQWFGIQWKEKDEIHFCNTMGEDWFLLRTDEWKIRRHLGLWVKAYGMDGREKRKWLLYYYQNIYPETCHSYELFIKEAGHEGESYSVQLLDFLFSEIDAELRNYSEEKLHLLAEKVSREQPLTVAQLFSGYLAWMREKGMISPGWEYRFQRRGNKRDTDAYTLEDFISMAYCVFNPEAWKREDMLSKAFGSSKYANLWLFIALHFLCGFRANDLERLPMPELPLKGKELRQRIQDGDLETAHKILGDMELRIAYVPMKPQKTKRFTNVPDLKIFIPESLREPMALILGLAVSFHEEKKAGEFFLKKAGTLPQLREFFGNEFTMACNGCRFSTRRANKSYLQGISTVSGEDSTPGKPKGYMLAALARSHKGGIGSLPEMTDIYLKDARFSGYRPEFIAREMLERGVFSFIPSVLLEQYAGKDYARLSVSSQTQLIKEFGIRPYAVESIVRTVEQSLHHARKIVAALLKEPEEIRGSLADILQRIASGSAKGKQEGLECLMMASGFPCVDIQRKGCIGCGYEIYTKSVLHQLVKEYARLNHLRKEIQGEETVRYERILKEAVMPAVTEIVVCMKNHDPQADMEIYRSIMKGGQKDAGISG